MQTILSVLALEFVIRSAFAESPPINVPIDLPSPCLLFCDSQYPCDPHISCPGSTNFEVRCVGNSSCVDTFIDCGQSDCFVHCSGLNSCRNITVNGTHATAVELKCEHPATCYGVDLRCSPSVESESRMFPPEPKQKTCTLSGM